MSELKTAEREQAERVAKSLIGEGVLYFASGDREPMSQITQADLAKALEKHLAQVERETRDRCAQIARECLKLWPTLAATVAKRIQQEGGG